MHETLNDFKGDSCLMEQKLEFVFHLTAHLANKSDNFQLLIIILHFILTSYQRLINVMTDFAQIFRIGIV